MKKERAMGLLGTSSHEYYDAELKIAINGQSALSVKQLFTIERLYVHWDNWKIKLAVWLISKTPLI